MDGAADKAAELANATLRSDESMSIYLNKDSKIIVQGMTGGMGSKHTTLMLEAGLEHRRRRQRPQGRHHRRARRPGAARLRLASRRR